jgi:ribosomal protein S18 acetylase RimI-like enzyme
MGFCGLWTRLAQHLHDEDAVILRSATVCDIPALSRLGIDSFVAKFGHLYRNEDLAAYLAEAHSEASVAAELANPDRLYQIAEQANALVGYCKLGLIGGYPEHARGTQMIELKQLYTAPHATGRGIGAALMDWALTEARARGADEMQLSVWSGNDGAQRFYARYGFVKVAEVDFWVGSQRDDEFLFSRLL